MIVTRFVRYFVLTTILMVTTVFAQEGSHTESKSALNGQDPVVLSKGKHEKGDQEFRADYDGYTYLFLSQRNRSTFKDSPEKFAGQDHGNCPVAKVMMHREMKGQPEIFSVYQGKIYLFANQDAKKAFDASPSKFAGSQSKKSPPREGSGY